MTTNRSDSAAHGPAPVPRSDGARPSSPALAFSIERRALDWPTAWQLDSYVAREHYVPLVGPSCWCAMLIFDADMYAASQYFALITYRVVDFAGRLGVKPRRVPHLLRRLEEHQLLVRNTIDSTLEHPIYLADRRVPDMSDYRWRLLPPAQKDRLAGWHE